MSASADLQTVLTKYLTRSARLRVAVPIIARRTKDLLAEINAAAANNGLCIWVMPPLPTRAMTDVPFVFFSGAEVRVRILEKTGLNNSGADAYDLADDVLAALHWCGIPSILSHPLQMAERPTEMVEDPQTRIIDCIFEAVYGFAQSDQQVVIDSEGLLVVDSDRVAATGNP